MKACSSYSFCPEYHLMISELEQVTQNSCERHFKCSRRKRAIKLVFFSQTFLTTQFLVSANAQWTLEVSIWVVYLKAKRKNVINKLSFAMVCREKRFRKSACHLIDRQLLFSFARCSQASDVLRFIRCSVCRIQQRSSSTHCFTIWDSA